METETYKVAKELLEKFDPSALKDKNQMPSPNTSICSISPPPGLRYRQIGSPQQQQKQQQMFNAQANSAARMNMSGMGSPNPMNSSVVSNRHPNSTPTGQVPVASPMRPGQPMPIMMRPMPPPRVARPILPQDRSVVEKLVDYVVGDGPANRFALICRNCHSHNGMALKDEFEYLAFRCCYCGMFNPARKERPFAPRLALDAPQPLVDEPESDSDRGSEKRAGSVDIVDVSSPMKDKDETAEDEPRKDSPAISEDGSFDTDEPKVEEEAKDEQTEEKVGKSSTPEAEVEN